MNFTRNYKLEPRTCILGATLIELLVVLVVLSVVAVGGFRYYQRFIDRQEINNTGNLIVSYLQEAQNDAMNDREQSRFGARITSQELEVLKEDDNLKVVKVLEFPENLWLSQINLNGDTEVVLFARQTGVPDNYGDLRLVSRYFYMDILISQSGVIERTSTVSRK